MSELTIEEKRALHAPLYEIAERVWNDDDGTGRHSLHDVVDAVAEAEREHCITLAGDLHAAELSLALTVYDKRVKEATMLAIDTAELAGRKANNAQVVEWLRSDDEYGKVGHALADAIERFEHIPCTCGECGERGSK